MEWVRSRGSTVVALGSPAAGARFELGYRGALDDEVALYTETLVAELVAGSWWQRQEGLPQTSGSVS